MPLDPTPSVLHKPVCDECPLLVFRHIRKQVVTLRNIHHAVLVTAVWKLLPDLPLLYAFDVVVVTFGSSWVTTQTPQLSVLQTFVSTVHSRCTIPRSLPLPL